MYLSRLLSQTIIHVAIWSELELLYMSLALVA